MEVYKVLSDVMCERKLTVADIARMSNLPDSTVRGIVTRKQKTVALDVAFKLSDGLGISLERLNGMDSEDDAASRAEQRTAAQQVSVEDSAILEAFHKASPEIQEAIRRILKG